MKNYQITIISNTTFEVLHLFNCNHVDAVKSHSKFYKKLHETFSLFEDLLSITVADKKIILHYEFCTAEIVKI